MAAVAAASEPEPPTTRQLSCRFNGGGWRNTRVVDYGFAIEVDQPSGETATYHFAVDTSPPRGGKAVDNGIAEDGGFAINGGKGFSKVIFTNHAIDLNGPVAIAMGDYLFTCATTNEDVKVEYPFGYKRNSDGKCRICLHHSSIPYAAH